MGSDPGRVLERLFELGLRLAGDVEQGLAESGLTRARAEVIWRLQQQGPSTQRALSDALQVTPRNVTGLVDALERDGWVTREPHPTDRRATLVTLTTRGETAANDMQAGYAELATLLFGDLSPSELARLATDLDRMLQRLRDRQPAHTTSDPARASRT